MRYPSRAYDPRSAVYLILILIFYVRIDLMAGSVAIVLLIGSITIIIAIIVMVIW